MKRLYYNACLAVLALSFLLYLGLNLFRFVWIGYLICAGLTALVWAAGMSIHGMLNKSRWLVFLLLYVLLSAFWQEDRSLAFERYFFNIVMLLPMFLVAFTWGQNLSPKQISHFFLLQIVLSLLAWGYSIVAEGEAEGFRSLLASSFLVSLPFVIWRVHVYKRASDKIFLGILILAFVLLGSRTAIVFAPILIYLSYRLLHKDDLAKGRKKFPIRSFAIVFTLLLMVLVVFGENVTSRFSGITSLSISGDVEDELNLADDEKVDLARRITIFTSMNNFLEHPIEGIGYMGTMATMQAKYGERDLVLMAHGVFPGLISEIGLIGVGIMFWVFYFFHRELSKAISLTQDVQLQSFLRICGVSLLAVFFIGLFHQILESAMFYVVMALGLGMSAKLQSVSKQSSVR